MPSTTSKNLGQVAAVFKGATPPTNLDLLWLDTSSNPAVKRVWDSTTSTWIPLNQVATLGDNWGTQVVVGSTELGGDGTTVNPLKIAQQGAAVGQVLKWDGSAWTPANDLVGSGLAVVTTSDEFTGSGTTGVPLKLAQNSAQDGYILTWVSSLGKYRPLAPVLGAQFTPGMIMLWSGSPSSVPAGWALCDGLSGRPNLKGMFVVGYDPADVDYNGIGKTGGEKRHSLTSDENGQHSHGVNDPGHSHNYTFGLDSGGNRFSANWMKADSNTNSKPTSTAYTGIAINNSGLGNPHENRPPYYVLAYIIKL